VRGAFSRGLRVGGALRAPCVLDPARLVSGPVERRCLARRRGQRPGSMGAKPSSGPTELRCLEGGVWSDFGKRCGLHQGARFTFYFPSASSHCIRILRAACPLPPRWSSGYFHILPRSGAVIFTIYTFISCTNHSAPALLFRTFFSFCLGTPPCTRAIRSRLVLTFPPSSQSVASRVSLEPPFPTRGLLDKFPQAFAAGRFSPSWAPSGLIIPSRGDRWRRRSSPPPYANAADGRVDVTYRAQWVLPLRDGSRPARVNSIPMDK
jgi:hypothetical protein